MEHLLKLIDEQITFNQNKNLLRSGEKSPLEFTDETIAAISELKGKTPENLQYLVEYATDKSLEAFCRLNQYYAFDAQARKALRLIYAEMADKISRGNIPAEVIAEQHFRKLKDWLLSCNPFAEKIYIEEEAVVRPVTCAQYSPELQMEVLGIEIKRLLQPVLDVGCGQHGQMVTHLREMGIDVYGIDRYTFEETHLITADWLEFEYGAEKWGTIISHLGFSNHFHHHHLREDGNYIAYARTYMKILAALRLGGTFYYAPALPFIECYLSDDQYVVRHKEISASDLKATALNKKV